MQENIIIFDREYTWRRKRMNMFLGFRFGYWNLEFKGAITAPLHQDGRFTNRPYKTFAYFLLVTRYAP